MESPPTYPVTTRCTRNAKLCSNMDGTRSTQANTFQPEVSLAQSNATPADIPTINDAASKTSSRSAIYPARLREL